MPDDRHSVGFVVEGGGLEYGRELIVRNVAAGHLDCDALGVAHVVEEAEDVSNLLGPRQGCEQRRRGIGQRACVATVSNEALYLVEALSAGLDHGLHGVEGSEGKDSGIVVDEEAGPGLALPFEGHEFHDCCPGRGVNFRRSAFLSTLP